MTKQQPNKLQQPGKKKWLLIITLIAGVIAGGVSAVLDGFFSIHLGNDKAMN